ncbi:MAG: cyanobactin biosynthesis PatC/TenC/TruC family protein [Geitlerinemataceae cyanobacterium]
MADAKKTSKKATASEAESADTNTEETNPQNLEPKAEDKPHTLSTGLEDYGRWRSVYQNHQRDKNEKPFRRGRVWS